jgi:hypothetical protein
MEQRIASLTQDGQCVAVPGSRAFIAQKLRSGSPLKAEVAVATVAGQSRLEQLRDEWIAPEQTERDRDTADDQRKRAHQQMMRAHPCERPAE